MLSPAKLYIGFTLIVILMLAALLDSLSRGATDPALAIGLNPLNADARVKWAAQELERRDPPPPALDDAQGELDDAAALNPVDARIYGLMGEIALLRNRPEEARALFERGLKSSPTEFYSLRRLIVLDLEKGDGDAVLGNLSVFLKRWPGRFGEVQNVFPLLMASDRGYSSVLKSASEGSNWRGRLLTFLASRPDLAPLAYRVLLDLRKGAAPLSDAEVNQVISNLFNKGQHRLAYQAYALMEIDRGKGEDLAFVTNSTFAPQTASSPFQWAVPGVTGAETVMSPDNAPGLRVAFRDKVVRGTLARQVVMLPSGPKEIALTTTADRLVAPKGLSWTVLCIGDGAVLVDLPIEPGSYADRTSTARFTVPEGSCESQELVLSTGVVSISMRYRYDGQVTVKKIEILNAED